MTRPREADPYLEALAVDDSLPIDPEAVRLWLADHENPLRWVVLPLLRWSLEAALHLIWLLKRASPVDVRAHGLLQWLICWFCEWFVSPEANVLILRHFATESNLLNFLVDNTRSDAEPVDLYPRRIRDMRHASFVDHDQALFRTLRDVGRSSPEPGNAALCWDHWRPVDVAAEVGRRRWTRVLDFETAHVLFMGLFCALLRKREYEAAINGFAFDQSVAIRIGRITGEPGLAEFAFNKYPLYRLGPWNLTQRFLMHGFFTEYLHAHLERLRQASRGVPVGAG